ncbi:ABC transporter substrate-binding protein [Labrys miyagiensis]|uniref:ABC transporter substrate-binding protein n=1 Tax=Labrys miyagiensis TaxID=346912 RepID=A0ABQ6CN56_9HYPH|nr:ABC transporter substrate-binding protein [Labrys miyagiensis]GLS21067.1 ABC transporter substrate-binding protein [Labrys miyagiensis]
MTDKTNPQNAARLIVDRRELMKGAAALGLGFGAFGVLGGPTRAADAPKKGGTFRIGMEGGSASDSLDPRNFADSIPLNYGYQIWNGLIEIDTHGKAVGELLESWESKPGATEWIFNIRKGVTFHSGKTLDADDIIYSINLHRGDTKSAAKDLLAGISDIKKLSPNQIQITLSAGNINLPYNLTDYHILGIPNGFTDFSKPDGTGAYKLVSFEPGVRVVTQNSGHYWKDGCGNFDGVELQYIPDATARMQALLAGQVDAINRIDPKTVDIVTASPDTQLVQSKGTGNRYCFAALCDTAPYDNLDTRLALKYGIDRKKIVDTVYMGYATVGNDTTISPMNPYFDKDLAQTPYDPEKAAFHYKKAGSPKLELKVSEGAFSGATDAGVLYQEAMKQAGIDLTVTRVSGDGYWSNVWMKDPFCAVYWGDRPAIDLQLSQTFLSDAAWNDTHWKRPDFDKLVIAARVEEDEAKRREMYNQAQTMIHDDGGMVVYAVSDYLDGYAKKIAGVAPHPRYDMCDQRAAEKAWFSA